jgi:excisionase family DNA binding protein
VTHSDTTAPEYGGSRLEPLLSVRQVATVFGISRETVYRLIRSGDLEPIRIGARARFAPDDVRAYLETHREAAAR